MEPWFSPFQIITSLGVTVPFFIWYSWRIYNMVLEHRLAFQHLQTEIWMDSILQKGWDMNEAATGLAMNSIYLYYDKKLGYIRRSLRADVYIIILLGFIGTLLGMITSFMTLLMSMGNKGIDPTSALTSLLKGGLSTALISSLIAALLACLVMGFLSFSEKGVVRLREKLNTACFNRYCQSGTREVTDVEP